MNLDESQLKAACHFGHNGLVLAGAGSGKTATLTERAVRLVEAGVDPSKMYMFTFTNKASKEMRERVINLFSQRRINQDIPNITTFHQFGYRLIKKYAEKCLRPEGQPSIMTEKEASSEWVKSLLHAGFSKDEYKENKEFLQFPGLIANEGIVLMNNDASFDSLYDFCKKIGMEFEFNRLATALIFYTETKINQNTLDFDDMILLPIYLLEQYPQIRNSISDYLIDVSVDESQDNNGAQYRLLKLITDSGKKVHVLMVGDDDQSIYEWRGSRPNGLKQYLKEFNAELFLLERNYRSNADIVSGASRLVSNNASRIEKKPFATRKASKKAGYEVLKGRNLSDSVYYEVSEDAINLGHKLSKIFKQKKERGEPLSEVAILYRTHHMGYFLDKVLSQNGILTNMIGGTGLMERKEVLMAVAALRLCANPYDQKAFERLSGLVSGFGKTSINAVVEAAKEQKKPLLGGITGLKNKINRHLMRFNELLLPLKDGGPESILAWADENMIDWLKKVHLVEVKQQVRAGKVKDDEEVIEIRVANLIASSLDNIKSVAKAISENIHLFPENKWEVLTELSLDAPQSKRENMGVKLSTIHGFKGLECKEVHIAGFTDGLMPKRNSDGVISNQEEERRLAYVAITRAEEHLYLHHVKRFDIFKGGQCFDTPKMPPSHYLKEFSQQENQEQERKANGLDFSIFKTQRSQRLG